ncbi:metalloregulator ArsR/SmtB family transcription factor [Salinibacterium sp. SYSU T00001]|uniref:ArsR/SmtB family transcription factor n=1 Tax=Homoserinimonas sedimenticola TaxID=2986805 RepID=UPI00223634AC|nr:metalloregulator ArsR/SmtB family transcription factor [Salinibacterium sedimenticola]MCW4385861.1 metalloregulator ArsR/SmtB family transcription factor [Salinibacterium sedimenticola]
MAEIDLDAVFTALGDPTRRGILTLLRDDDATVGQLAHHFPISQPAISRHLRVLEEAGLIHRRHVGTATISSLRADPLEDAARWLIEYGEFWERRYEPVEPLLDAYPSADGWII